MSRRIAPTTMLVGLKGPQGIQGEVGPSGGPFPDLTGVPAGRVPQTLGAGAVEFVDLSATLVATDRARRTPADSYHGHGHSFGEGVSNSGTLVEGGMHAVAAELLGLPLRNESIGGTVLYNYVGGGAAWPAVLRQCTRPARFTPPTGLRVSIYGMNDLNSLGNTLPLMQPFIMAQRVAISRWRAGRIFENNDSTVVLGGAGTWSTDSSSANSGGTSRYNTTNGGTIAITTPADFPGGTIALGFIAWNDSGGAVITGTVNGIVYSIDTRATSSAVKTCSVLRIPNVPAGSATYTFTTSSCTGAAGAMFDYWQWEAPEDEGALVALVKQPVPLDLSPYSLPVTAAGIGIMNAAFDTLAAEFGGIKVITIDTSVMDANANYFASGNVHPTARGHRKLGEIIADALRDYISPTLTRDWQEPRKEFGTAPPTGTDRNYRVGDRVVNLDPATTPVAGWVCTVAGAPGTWLPEATLNTGTPIRITWGSAAPTTGAHSKGDLHINDTTTATGASIGWICTAPGTPGTWAPLTARASVGEGQVVLVAGTATITGLTSLSNGALIELITAGKGSGNMGALYVSNKTAGTGFAISSTNAADTQTVQWIIWKY
jgi:hypothetical protein